MKKFYSKTLAFLMAFALCLTMIVPAALADDDSAVNEPTASEDDDTSVADVDTNGEGTDSSDADGENTDDETTESNDADDDSEAELSIKKTSDKTTYSVGATITYTIELDELIEGATATEVELTDMIPIGMHIGLVSVEGAEKAKTTPVGSERVVAISYDDDTDSDDNNNDENNDGGDATSDESDALKRAEAFLSVMPFSYKGLISQLVSNGFSTADAVYAADNCGADWFEQAILQGEIFIESTNVRYNYYDILDMLENARFTTDEATYAANVLFEEVADGVEIYIPSIEYGQNVTVTIRAYADEPGEYTNTAFVESAETDSISDSVTITVEESTESDGDTGSGTGGSGTGGSGTSGSGSGSGTSGSGTTRITSPQTGEIIGLGGLGMLAVIALAAGTVLIITVATGRRKDNN